jgi:type VI protein secretion system component Hcp
MKKLIAILGGVFILFIFTSLPCWADPCLGDFDCDGDVDGYNLAQFSSNFGLNDCSSSTFVVFGSAEFSGLGQTDYYEVSMESISLPGPDRLDSQFRLKLKESGITQQLIIKAAQQDHIPEVVLYFGRIGEHGTEEFLRLQDVFLRSVKYLPPVQNNDPYLVEVLLDFGAMSHLLDQCPAGAPAEIKLINTAGYTGSIPLPGYEDYTAISDFHFDMLLEKVPDTFPPQYREVFDPVEIVSAYNEVSVCFLKWAFNGSHIPEARIEKFGQRRDDGPESRIELRDIIFTGIQLAVSSGNIELTFAIAYDRIEFTHWEFIDGDWQEQTTSWDVRARTPR